MIQPKKKKRQLGQLHSRLLCAMVKLHAVVGFPFRRLIQQNADPLRPSFSGFRLTVWLVVFYHPSENMTSVNWDDDIPKSYGKIKFMATKPPTSCGMTINHEKKKNMVTLTTDDHDRSSPLFGLKDWNGPFLKKPVLFGDGK